MPRVLFQPAVRELRVYALDVSKLGRIHTVLAHEMDDCAKQQQTIEAEIASAEVQLQRGRQPTLVSTTI